MLEINLQPPRPGQKDSSKVEDSRGKQSAANSLSVPTFHDPIKSPWLKSSPIQHGFPPLTVFHSEIHNFQGSKIVCEHITVTCGMEAVKKKKSKKKINI